MNFHESISRQSLAILMMFLCTLIKIKFVKDIGDRTVVWVFGWKRLMMKFKIFFEQ